MAKRQRYPYPVPELIAYLEAMQDLTQDDPRDYLVLVKLLQFCHATVAHANQIWHTGRYTAEDPEIVTYQAIHFGFKRLIPLIIGATESGWHELLAYIEHPETFPWYNPETDWPCVPPLDEFRPEEDEVDTASAKHEKEVATEEVVAVAYATNTSS